MNKETKHFPISSKRRNQEMFRYEKSSISNTEYPMMNEENTSRKKNQSKREYFTCKNLFLNIELFL